MLPGSALSGLARPVRAPHLLKIVELTDVRAKDVHDRVARVQEDPVAQRQPLDSWGRKAGVSAGFHDTVGNRADMCARPSRRNDHAVSERRLAGKFDRYDTLRFRVFKTTDNDAGKSIDRGFVDKQLAARLRRSSMRRECQLRVPLRRVQICPGRRQDEASAIAFQALPGRQVVSTILPIWAPLSMRACALAASASGNTELITGLQWPASISGQTLSKGRWR